MIACNIPCTRASGFWWLPEQLVKVLVVLEYLLWGWGGGTWGRDISIQQSSRLELFQFLWGLKWVPGIFKIYFCFYYFKFKIFFYFKTFYFWIFTFLFKIFKNFFLNPDIFKKIFLIWESGPFKETHLSLGKIKTFPFPPPDLLTQHLCSLCGISSAREAGTEEGGVRHK